MNLHRQKQVAVINEVENQIKNNCLQSSIVTPIEDFTNDPHICLTSIHFPHYDFINYVQQSLIKPLRKIDPRQYYYEPSSIHITIKNVRTINNPPHFSQDDIVKVKNFFTDVVPQYKQFKVYFYRFLLFPLNLSLMGTTDPELDNVILDLDNRLKEIDIPDDKKYVNSRYFFCNITLVRFLTPVSEEYKNTINNISQNINFQPYTIDSVTLLTCNAILKKRQIIGTWPLCAV